MPTCGTRKLFRIRVRNGVLELGSRTLVMGILNVTPDSFSDGGRFLQPADAVRRAWKIAEEGADILDIGGESTRPGSGGVSVEEELDRITPVLEALGGSYPLPISIDTSKSEVAAAALERGASIINDVSGLRHDSRMAEVARSTGAAVVLMHMRGTPANMQKIPPSPDIMGEIEQWADDAVENALAGGVRRDRIILDPGIGFGKTADQNLEILHKLERLGRLGFPVLVGVSRKAFLRRIVENDDSGVIYGTGAAVAASIMFGAHIVRVHDVAEMCAVARVTDAIVDERLSR